MEISIAGKHIQLGASLEEYVQERLTYSLKKLLQNVTKAEVFFDKKNSMFEVAISVKESHGISLIRSEDSSDDAYHAFDHALIKLEKQLRKHKERIKDHHHKKKLAEASSDIFNSIKATKYILDSNIDEIASENTPVIIEERETHIETLSVAEAVMKMDLQQLPALLFKNVNNGNLNVVYYRKDGNIAWVNHE